MADKVVEGAIPNPLGNRLLLNFGENVKAAFNVSFLIKGVFREGLFILTNHRIIIFDKEFQTIISDIPLVALTEVYVEKNMMINKELRDVLQIAVGSIKYVIDVRETFSVEEVAKAILKLRAKEMLRASKPLVDFSLLKSILDKGGIVATTIKCPSCGGILDVPNEGKFVKCRYCGHTIFVEEAINMIREMEGL